MLKEFYKLPVKEVLIWCSIFLLMSCGENGGSTFSGNEASSGKVLFTRISPTKSNVDFQNNLVDDPLNPLQNVMDYPNYFNGAGTAIADFDNDGLADLFFVGNEVPNKIYRNKGDFEFEDKTASANVNKGKGWRNGVSVVDINQDGFLDIYVCQSSSFRLSPAVRPNLLFINNGDFTFTESANKYGLDNTDLSHQASFFDYDLDGDLDCFLLNTSIYVRVKLGEVFRHLDADEKNLRAASCKLLENKNGKFVDVTEQAGMLRYGFGLGLVVNDLNDDGYPDVYVANDYSVPDLMYINNGDGTFTDQVKTMTNQISFYAMGIDIADINNDGLVDIGVVDMAADDHIRSKTLMASMSTKNFNTYVNQLEYQHQYMFNSMQLNNGNGTFSNIVNLSGLAQTDWSWSALLADFDNDGYRDYFVTNGYRRYSRDNDSRIKMTEIRNSRADKSVPVEMRKQLYSELPSVRIMNSMFKNNQDLTFSKVSEEWGMDEPTFSNGASYGDLDNDGDLDLIINNVAGFASLYKNNSTNNYLEIQLKPGANIKNIENTKITIKTGSMIQYSEYTPTRGFLSSMENGRVVFGLGKTDKVDRLEITWPDGKKNYLADIAANQNLILSPEMTNAGPDTPIMNKSTNSIFAKVKDAAGINFTHRENDFDDFEKEILLPHKQSAQGPKMAMADVNGDGLSDLFIPNAKDANSTLFLQTSNEQFTAATDQPWNTENFKEQVSAHFFDYDNDNDLDLYICNGGGGDLKPNDNKLIDRLYKNNGKGKFTMTNNVIPSLTTVSSVARSSDFDGDGDLDLFVGGRAIPGKYPFAERSYLLVNENGKFKDATSDLAPELLQPGLVTDAIWVDLDGDQKEELVVVGEWMGVSVYQTSEDGLEEVSKSYGLENLNGWWYSVVATDLDNDGDLDLICGNNSPNTKFKASKEKPFNLFAEDFDGNGSCDIVLSKEYNGKLVPTRGRECSSQQMPFIKEKFPTYNDFAHASIEDIYGDKLDAALHLEVNTFYSMALINESGTFKIKKLPNQVQVAPINGIVTTDVNKDGNMDLIVAGNNFDTEVETARYDAGTGAIMLGDGKGGFDPLSVNDGGIFAPQNVKDIKLIDGAKGANLLVISTNNGPVQVFKSDNSSLQ